MGMIINRRRVSDCKIDWEKQYLTFIPVEDAVFTWAERAVSGHLEYSINGGQTWVTIADGESTPTITAGSKVLWRGDLKPVALSTTKGIGTFSATGNYNAYGNTMSLLFYDNFYGGKIQGTVLKCAFAALFYGDTNIITPPLLPSTTLASHCYFAMFYGCTSLTQAPELPATTLTSYCYYMMFRGCTNLNYVKCLATSGINTTNLSNWLRDVSATGTFVKAASASYSTGASGIPSDWTVVDDPSTITT